MTFRPTMQGYANNKSHAPRGAASYAGTTITCPPGLGAVDGYPSPLPESSLSSETTAVTANSSAEPVSTDVTSAVGSRGSTQPMSGSVQPAKKDVAERCLSEKTVGESAHMVGKPSPALSHHDANLRTGESLSLGLDGCTSHSVSSAEARDPATFIDLSFLDEDEANEVEGEVPIPPTTPRSAYVTPRASFSEVSSPFGEHWQMLPTSPYITAPSTPSPDNDAPLKSPNVDVSSPPEYSLCHVTPALSVSSSMWSVTDCNKKTLTRRYPLCVYCQERGQCPAQQRRWISERVTRVFLPHRPAAVWERPGKPSARVMSPLEERYMYRTIPTYMLQREETRTAARRWDGKAMPRSNAGFVRQPGQAFPLVPVMLKGGGYAWIIPEQYSVPVWSPQHGAWGSHVVGSIIRSSSWPMV